MKLLDAVTVTGLAPSLAYLSLPPMHRRRWGSLYEALAAGDMDAPALRELVARYPLDVVSTGGLVVLILIALVSVPGLTPAM